MNRGLRLAQGEIIGFLNADDYYEPEILASVSNEFRDMRGAIDSFWKMRNLE